MTWARVIGSLIVRPDRPPIDPDERRMLDAVIADPDDDAPAGPRRAATAT